MCLLYFHMIIHYNILGCWRPLQPIAQTTSMSATAIITTEEGDLTGQVPAATQNLDCVYGSSDQDGKWAVSNCNTNVAGRPISTAQDTELGAGVYTFTTAPAKFGSICESDVPSTTVAPPTTPATPETSDSTCLKSGITIMIGMLFFCYQ